MMNYRQPPKKTKAEQMRQKMNMPERINEDILEREIRETYGRLDNLEKGVKSPQMHRQLMA